jgi:hypothetical protein
MEAVAEQSHSRSVQASDDCRPAFASIWIPWLAAPLFAVLPLAGCWLASCLQASDSRIAQQHQPERSVPTIPMASFVGITPGR